MFADATRSNTLVVAASTLLVAALFQPIRRRVQAPVDRRFNRAHLDAERVVRTFAQQTRDEVDLERLTGCGRRDGRPLGRTERDRPVAAAGRRHADVTRSAAGRRPTPGAMAMSAVWLATVFGAVAIVRVLVELVSSSAPTAASW